MSRCEGTERRTDGEIPNDAARNGEPDEDAPRDDGHLEEIPDGAGCTGIWEYLSAKREADDD